MISNRGVNKTINISLTLILLIIVSLLPWDAVQANVLEANADAVPDLSKAGMNDERLPYHLDSLIGLLVCAVALFVAWAMNHSRSQMRVVGIGAAAATCLAVGVGIFGLHSSGAFDTVRPALFPSDNAKPMLMRIHGVVFFIAGLALIIVAFNQSRRTDTLSLPVGNDEQKYGLASRYYHWSIAVLFLLLMPMGIYTSMIPEDQSHRQAFYVIHKSLGFTVLLLAIARLIWIIKSPAPKISSGLKKWEKFLAHSAHYGLYFFLFAFPITGFMLSTYVGKLSHFFFWDTPLFWGADEEAVKPWGLAHKIILPYLFYLIILGHIVGALKHQYLDKHKDSFKRIVT